MLLEANKIYQGDCFKIMSDIPDKSIDMIFTSPPHNRKRNDKYKYYDDTISDYYAFLKLFVLESIRVSKGFVFINIMKNYYNKKDVFKLIGDFSEEISEIFVWEKSNPLPGAGFSITNAYEFILCFGGVPKSNRTYTKNHLTTSVAKMPKEHKAVMNIKVAEFFIGNFAKPGQIILDPFMGYGTTAVASLKLGCQYIGIEISEEYCKMAEERIKQEGQIGMVV